MTTARGIVCRLADVENRPYHARLAKSIVGWSSYAATSMRSNGSRLRAAIQVGVVGTDSDEADLPQMSLHEQG